MPRSSNAIRGAESVSARPFQISAAVAATPRQGPVQRSTRLVAGVAALAALPGAASAQFAVEEATIEDVHNAIVAGETTCVGIVEAYIARAQAYNGVCTALVTPYGQDVRAVTGYVRAGAPLTYPTATVKASEVFPDLDAYRGLPLDYGRMEPTISDPAVLTQMGMRVGIPNAGQLNALETFNIRGERSVTCAGAFDAHPSTGPLPDDAPPECEEFRQQPDARERAAELDARYGANPDLEALPMYCVVAAFKDPYDTKDMRTTANNDVAFAMDAPPFDSTVVARLRDKGAIIYAKSVAAEFNGGPGNPGGPETARTHQVRAGQQMNSWSGQACNPYDTERVPRGTSGGSGVAIGANLAQVGICEQSGASCQGPASRNGVALLLTTKGLVPDSGGIGNQWFNDRAGIHARTLADAARVLDAIAQPETGGFYDPHDPFTALPSALVSDTSYAGFTVGEDSIADKPLSGVRIAILREHMAMPTANHVAISQQIDSEIKAVLRDQLGAEIVETVTSKHPDDPDVPNLGYSFADALSELLPRLMPEIFRRRDEDGELVFAVPGHDVESYEYLFALSRREAPLTDAVDITNFAGFGRTDCHSSLCSDNAFDIERYLAERGDTRIRKWEDWVANAKFVDDDSRAGAENWVVWNGHMDPGKGDRLARSYVAQMALRRVMHENGIDLFVHAENTVPTPKILGPNVGTYSLDGITPFFQIPRIVVPAGMSDVIYEPTFALNDTATDYVSVLPPGTEESRLPKPMPIAITFFSDQGQEPMLIRVGTAYEAATRHRTAPPDFGPLDEWSGR
jgi:Asp-tRNA(Asn)/Glu-tRNA(Gln) amidotransferase A subunit family amidase